MELSDAAAGVKRPASPDENRAEVWCHRRLGETSVADDRCCFDTRVSGAFGHVRYLAPTYSCFLAFAVQNALGPSAPSTAVKRLRGATGIRPPSARINARHGQV